MGEDRTDGPQAHQRLTVAQAATSLGITEGAVRSRIKRGTLPISKEGRTVFVLLGGAMSQANQPPNIGVPNDQTAVLEAKDETIGGLRSRVVSLEQVVASLNDHLTTAQANNRDLAKAISEATDSNSRIQQSYLAALSRLRELEAPDASGGDSEASESAYNPPGTGGTQTASQGPQTPPRAGGLLGRVRRNLFGR